jgi:hypothetical protein
MKAKAERCCARCQNHGIRIKLQFHKKLCDYLNCICPLCIKTAARQNVVRTKISKRRAKEIAVKLGLESVVKPGTQPAVHRVQREHPRSPGHQTPHQIPICPKVRYASWGSVPQPGIYFLNHIIFLFLRN